MIYIKKDSKMSEQYIGCSISLEAKGGLGFYQGIVKDVNIESQMITLIKAVHNGKPLCIPTVSIR